MTKPNEQHQFDMHIVPHNVFEENSYMLTGVDVTSRYKVSKTLTTIKESEVAFVLEEICKKSGVL